jgi:hypothetical protein
VVPPSFISLFIFFFLLSAIFIYPEARRGEGSVDRGQRKRGGPFISMEYSFLFTRALSLKVAG